ncbi:acyltransferase [Streptococcus porcinus]|uniref:Acyltransferase n=1 Tax=Streptococcus porcinus TaxID=1340 RepID=A0A7V9WT58_STRPO|nr:acyltransferase [Streptococcus porcinus]MBA2796620.1 acyltransferase [Streptococcus porcinus]
MKMKIKQLSKIFLTYLFNWQHIIRFKEIGKNVIIGKRTITNFAGDGIFIGNNVRFGNDLRLSLYSSTVSQKPKIVIKDNVYAGNHISLLTASDIVIEEDVLMASYINILGENHSMDPMASLTYGKQPLITAPITIKKGSWIGQNVSILCGSKGITIGEKSIIGTGSVVTKSIPDFSIAVGNPAKVIKIFNFDSGSWEVVNERIL